MSIASCTTDLEDLRRRPLVPEQQFFTLDQAAVAALVVGQGALAHVPAIPVPLHLEDVLGPLECRATHPICDSDMHTFRPGYLPRMPLKIQSSVVEIGRMKLFAARRPGRAHLLPPSTCSRTSRSA
jgi:hypothetical protein